ncbi:MAG: hypothetical protein KAW93_09180 [Methanogenium sp.]|nr:hypothetical protein [Methanogenium sp.]
MKTKNQIETQIEQLEEQQAEVQTSEQEQEEFEKFRMEVLNQLCDACCVKVEDAEQTLFNEGPTAFTISHPAPKGYWNFQHGFAHTGVCTPCRNRVSDHLKGVVEP